MTTVIRKVEQAEKSNVTVEDVVNTLGDKFFTVKFTKKDGSERVMNARRGVIKYLKGGTSTIAAKPNLVSVYDLEKKSYRCFDVDRVKEIHAGGKVYKFD